MRITPPRLLFEIQEQDWTNNPDGTATNVWQRYRIEWGTIKPLSATERTGSKDRRTEVTHRITLRYVEKVTAKNRLVLQPSGRVFNILGVINTGEANVELEIDAVELS